MVSVVALLILQTSFIEGTVFQPDGTPAAGAEVGITFQFSKSNPIVQIGYGGPGIKTNSEGRFQIAREESYNGLVVASARGSAGFAEVSPDGPVKIQLAPLKKVDMSLKTSDKVNDKPASATFSFNNRVIGYGTAEWSGSSLLLPAGNISVDVVHEQCRISKAVITFPNTIITMQLTKWKSFIGKQAPEITPTEPKTLNLNSLRGKWIVIDYWATWCAPCINAFPGWFKFVKDNASRRDKFEILAIHSPDGESRSAIDEALRGIIKSKWQGITPPFPLVFDKTGKTHERWGIEAYPTTLLIDPQGNLVGETSPEDLQQRLDSKK